MRDIQEKTVVALLPVSLLGAFLNWSIVFSIQKLSSFNHSFGYLSGNQALADALHSTTFLLYFCPMVLLNNPLMKMYSHHCGFVLLFCYELSVLTHLVISLNRCIAAWAPYHYQQIFTDGKTKMVIVCVWVYTGTVAILFYEKFCYFYFDEKTQFLTFTKSDFCGLIGWYGDFLKNATIVAIIVCIDIVTVLRVRKVSKKIITCINQESQQQFSRREIRFLKQTVFQGAVFLLELLTYFFVPQYFENPWIVFLATSFAWVAIHAVDDIVVLVCNPEIRRYLFSRGKLIHAVTTVSSSQIH